VLSTNTVKQPVYIDSGRRLISYQADGTLGGIKQVGGLGGGSCYSHQSFRLEESFIMKSGLCDYKHRDNDF